MRDLLACLTDRELEIGGRSFRVRPPSLEEALRVTAALEAMRDGEENAWSALQEECAGWLPDDLAQIYFGEDAYPAGTVKDVQELLAAGVKDRHRHARDEEVVQEETRDRSWFAVVADYADAMNTPALEVMQTPFPYFIALCAEAFRIQERRKADVMIGYLTARSGGDLFGHLMKAAGYADETEPGEWNPRPGWDEAAQIEKAKLYAQTGGKMGEA